MKLIFIYGPPAVGKTTVGGKLAELTGYRFFFNHLTVPAAKAIFPHANMLNESKDYRSLLIQLRLDSIAAAAKAGADIIFTAAYSGAIDDTFVADFVEIVTSHGGEVHFVQLSAPPEILKQRVGNPSRQELHLGKMTSPEHLQQVLEARDMYASVKYPEILKLDTVHLEPEAVAERIASRFRLDRAAKTRNE
jgi:shikimate kinase